ncbi:prolipoprotein diacylglyceryl transferase [Patescibacteria group bacterium]
MIPYGQITEFVIGPLAIQSWGLMVAAGFIVGILLILWQASKEGYKVNKLVDLALLLFIGSMIGARVVYVILFWENFAGDNWLEMFKIWNGGMVYYGGFIGALVVWIAYSKWKKLNIWKLADWGAPALALGLAIGRFGCHFIRDHIGTHTDLPWAVEYAGELRHDTALYSICANLLIFLLIWFWLRKKRMITGYLFVIFVIWYGLTRFIIDFFRAYDLPYSDPRFWSFGGFPGLTISQIISLLLIIGAIGVIFYLKKNRPPTTAGLEYLDDKSQKTK